jgi:hypothetical protein
MRSLVAVAALAIALATTSLTAAVPKGRTTKISLKSRPARRNLRRSLHGSTANVPLTDQFRGTDLEVTSPGSQLFLD